MAKQMHFVICYDLETKQMWQDTGTENAKFPEGVFYDENTDEWSFGDDEDIDPANEAQRKVSEILAKHNT